MEDRRQDSGWHMSKSLSVSHLLGTIAIAVGFFTYVTDIEQETIVNKAELKSVSERLDRSNVRYSEEFSEIKEMFKHLSAKIDRMLQNPR
jgi:hypothetical protein|tara:strand:+ start:629 stop:898 length:270 start_codon:yes stop_codon:yes gene_type:complete